MKRLIATAFVLSLLGGAAASAQQDDNHHHGMGGGHQGQQGAAPAPAAAAPAPTQHPGWGGRPGAGQGAAPAGPQYSHGNGPLFGPPARPQGQAAPQGRPQGQAWQQGQAPQQTYQGRGYDQGRGGRGPQAYGGPAPRDYQRGQDGRHEWNAQQRFRGPAYAYPRGFGFRQWSFGEFLPAPFFGGDYVIGDYWDYGLPAPPYGFEWVRVGADALLVRPVDGYILDVAHNLFW